MTSGNISVVQAPIITICASGQETVRLNTDGTVTWPNGINVDAAAKAFGDVLSLGAEYAAGLSQKIKNDIRDQVYKELIEECKTKEFLSVDDLTYLQEASKIVNKLKGEE